MVEHMFEQRALQLALLAEVSAPSAKSDDPGMNYGEVFTRQWVVDLILDLVGYTPDHDLASKVLVEPSCGTGAFLASAVKRLIESSDARGHNPRTLGPAIRAFDLLDANAERARKLVAGELMATGLSDQESKAIADEWVRTGDFLLHEHQSNSADFVVGNPPYVRLEDIPKQVMENYRLNCPTMRGRADLYVGFIERGLDLLKAGGALSYICADRWMHNQYGKKLRRLISDKYSMQVLMSMHDVDAFEDDVSAYPAIVVLGNREQKAATVVDVQSGFGEHDTTRLTSWITRGPRSAEVANKYKATRVAGWFSGEDLWPAGSPKQLRLIADLERRFPPIERSGAGTRVGIGVATGCDDVFLTGDSNLVEDDRLLPIVQVPDVVTGRVAWAGTYLVNPWTAEGLIDLDSYPKLASYLESNASILRARYVARRRPSAWYRTIDRVNLDLTSQSKLLLPDLKAAAHPVLDDGQFYPHHNLYYVISDDWDLEVLGGLLLSDVANLFVGAYCVKMRGGTYRFQAQYLRRIRVPHRTSVTRSAARDLARAFSERDRERASWTAARLYDIAPSTLAAAM